SFSPDGKYVVTTSQDNTARVWEGWQAGAPKVVKTLSESSEIIAAGFSPDGNYILTAGGEGKVRVWEWKDDPPVEKARLDIAVALSGAAPTIETPAIPSTNVPPVTAPSPSPVPSVTPGASPVPFPTPGKILIYKAVFSPD